MLGISFLLLAGLWGNTTDVAAPTGQCVILRLGSQRITVARIVIDHDKQTLSVYDRESGWIMDGWKHRTTLSIRGYRYSHSVGACDPKPGEQDAQAATVDLPPDAVGSLNAEIVTDGDTVYVSAHNGSEWYVTEIVVRVEPDSGTRPYNVRAEWIPWRARSRGSSSQQGSGPTWLPPWEDPWEKALREASRVPVPPGLAFMGPMQVGAFSGRLLSAESAQFRLVGARGCVKPRPGVGCLR